MMDKRVIVVSDVTPNIIGGGSRYHYLLIKGLTELGYRTRVAFLQEGKKGAKEALGDITVAFDGPYRLSSGSTILRRLRQVIATFGNQPMVVAADYSQRFCSSVLESIAEFDPHLIVVSHLRVGYVISEIRKRYPDKKIIFVDHNCEIDVRRLYGIHGTYIDRFLAAKDMEKLQKYEGDCIRHSDGVIVLSQRDRKLVESLYKPKALFCIPPSLEDSFIGDTGFRTCGCSEKRILHSGSLSYRAKSYNLEWCVKEVFPLVSSVHPDVQLDIIGAGASRRLRRLVAMNSSINLLGWVDDLVPYYRKASVFVLPTLIGGGFELKALQASVMGCPIVGTSIPLESIGFESETHCLMAKDSSSFAACIVRLLSDTELAVTLARNAYMHVREEYKWVNFVSALMPCVR